MGFYNCDRCNKQIHTSHMPNTLCESCSPSIPVDHYKPSMAMLAPKVLSCLSDTKYGPTFSMQSHCVKCKESAITLVDGVCNTCLSSASDAINWPKHYNMGKIQPIDVIESWNLDFRLANSLKYIARAGKKDPVKTKEDLEKAIWYIKRFIEKELK